MPTIGWFEILIVVAIAIVVLGPKDFPIMLKKVGSWIGTAKKYINNIQNEVSEIAIDENEIKSDKGVQVEINGDLFNCSVIKEPLYDPSGQKMRS